MGTLCSRSNFDPEPIANLDDFDDNQVVQITPPKITETETIVESSGVLRLWEERQKARNETIKTKLIEEFHNRPDNFVANLLLVSLQFFTNFEKEKNEACHLLRDRETYLNELLLTSERKSLFMGSQEEISGHHVVYHPNSSITELPTPLQIYIIQDNAELFHINSEDELPAYNNVDGPPYRFIVEESVKHPGFVRLRCADFIPGTSRNSVIEDIYDKLPPVEDDHDPFFDRRPGKSMRRNSSADPSHIMINPEFEKMFENAESPKHSNGINVDSIKKHPLSSYQSRTERRPSGVFPKMGPSMNRLVLKTPKKFTLDVDDPLAKALGNIEEEEEDESGSESGNESEDEVKTELTNPSDEDYDDDSFEEEIKDLQESEMKLHTSIQKGCIINRKIQIKKKDDVLNVDSKVLMREYFSSSRYLDTFEEEFRTLAAILGKEYLAERYEVKGPSVCVSDYVSQMGPKYSMEFIPTLVYNEWPEFAREWKTRKRVIKVDDDLRIMYTWPPEQEIEKIVGLGCNVVPFGYYNPKGRSKAMDVEWQCHFTKAEQALMRTLGQSQLKLLLIAEALVFDHLGRDTPLTPQHLRYILFWMCEEDFKDWDEERLGIKLKRFFKIIYRGLAKEEFPHYFVESFNMLTVIPEKHIRKLQEGVKRLYENLPVCMMHTLVNMVSNKRFYASLNILEIYHLVTRKKFGLELLNPNLNIPTENNEEDLNDEEESEEEMDEKDREYKRKTFLKIEELQNKNKSVEKRSSLKEDIIDTKKSIQRLNDLRKEMLFEIFAKHFIKLAKSSIKFRSYPQAYMYLLMAGNMADLLEDKANNTIAADDYRQQIGRIYSNSRGGIQDMLGSTWGARDSYEVVAQKRSSSSNWDFKTDRKLPSLPSSPITSPQESSRTATSPLTSSEQPSQPHPSKFNVKSQQKQVAANLSTIEVHSQMNGEVDSIDSSITAKANISPQKCDTKTNNSIDSTKFNGYINSAFINEEDEPSEKINAPSDKREAQINKSEAQSKKYESEDQIKIVKKLHFVDDKEEERESEDDEYEDSEDESDYEDTKF